jgi:hypothetical protein
MYRKIIILSSGAGKNLKNVTKIVRFFSRKRAAVGTKSVISDIILKNNTINEGAGDMGAKKNHFFWF